MKHYFISKDSHKEIAYVSTTRVNGYHVAPKNVKYDGIKVNSLVIIKPALIEKIIKRKTKYKIGLYLKLLIDYLDGDDDDTRKALSDIQRYRQVIQKKYSLYLDEKYLALLNKKIDIIERELKSNLVYMVKDTEPKKSR